MLKPRRATRVLTYALIACAFARTATGQTLRASNSETITTKQPEEDSSSHHHGKKQPGLSSDERLAVLASALDSKTPRYAEGDCSHLIHAIYERAGFPYNYADSDDLYAGVHGFQRVSHPEPGDIVVWHGHAGIVIRPSKHVFYSFLHAGPGVDDYESRYWKGRGQARFFRYIKSAACEGCRASK
jgi:hypothetical protein